VPACVRWFRGEALLCQRSCTFTCLLASIVSIALISTACARTVDRSLAVPSYFKPGPQWTRMENAYSTVRTSIINPVNGLGNAVKPAYAHQVRKSQAADLRVLGYVSTHYGGRSIGAVESEIDGYYSWYGVDGIFLDEASTDCRHAQTYYMDLYRYVKKKGDKGMVVLNPGMPTGECYMEVADTIVTFEGPYDKYVNDYAAPSWVSRYRPQKFWHLVHSTPTIRKMETAIRLSTERGAGWVYVTPSAPPNPWDTLPPDIYWSRELTAVSSGE
jgi:Spherulation-specific family 4